MRNYPTGIRLHDWAGVSIDEFPHLAAWVDRIEARPAVVIGRDIPEKDSLTKMKNDPAHAEKMAKQATAWVSTTLSRHRYSRPSF